MFHFEEFLAIDMKLSGLVHSVAVTISQLVSSHFVPSECYLACRNLHVASDNGTCIIYIMCGHSDTLTHLTYSTLYMYMYVFTTSAWLRRPCPLCSQGQLCSKTVLCSNALKCFNYASKNCYYALAYNIIHKQVA